MTWNKLAIYGIRYHWRSYISLASVIAVACGVLTGALIVGDSLRKGLEELGQRRTGGIASVATLGRPLPLTIVDQMKDSVVPVLLVRGSITANSNFSAGIQIWGLDSRGESLFGLSEWTTLWGGRDQYIIISKRLADRLKVHQGQRVVLSVERISVLPRNTLLARRSFDDSVITSTFTIAGILPDDSPASEFAISPQLDLPLNAYVPLRVLAELFEGGEIAEPFANVLLSRDPDNYVLTESMRRHLRLEHYGLRLRNTYRSQSWLWWNFQGYINIESDRMIFEDDISYRIIDIVNSSGYAAEPTLIYLVESIKYDNHEIPYAIIAGVNPDAKSPLGPFHTIDGKTIQNDEIALLDWRDSPLKGLSPDKNIELTITYYHPEVEGEGKLETIKLKFCGYIPMSGSGGDRYLTPLVRGITDQGTHPRDWDRPPQLTNAKVREKIRAGDVHDRFWQQYGPTPKAFVNMATARKLFSSRYGSTTSIRVATSDVQTIERLLLDRLDPHMMGMGFKSLKQLISSASRGVEMFSILFLSFSIFIIISSLLLIILVYRLSVERRSSEIGILLSLGFNRRDSMYLLLTESFLISLLGVVCGLGLGILYCFFVLDIWSSLWPADDIKQIVKFHIESKSFILGILITLTLGFLSQWWALRSLVSIQIPQLLNGEQEGREIVTVPRWRPVAILAVICLVGAGMFALWSAHASTPQDKTTGFFGAGFLLLGAGVAALYTLWLRGQRGTVQGSGWRSLARLGWRNLERWPRRSLLTVGLLSAAVFLLVAVESFRRVPDPDIWDKASGSGGFNLICECDIPLYNPLQHGPGRMDLETQLQSAYGGSSEDRRFQDALRLLDRIEIEMLRLREGDDASCGNLYQTQRPRVLGVSQQFIHRGGFRFSRTLAESEAERNNPWLLLLRTLDNGEVPIFCEQDTAQWKFFTDVGGTIILEEDNGKQIICRLVGTLLNSPFPGELVMADEHFRRVFPRTEGYRFLLIRTTPEDEEFARQVIESGLRRHGARVVRTSERLSRAAGIIGAYLTTFQVLGALGLLLGIGGQGIVILRNIWERIGEFALLRAMGYRMAHLQWLIFLEHAFLLTSGILLGIVSASLAVLPQLWTSGTIPWKNLAILLSGIVICGFAVAYWGSRSILRLPLLTALRNK
ncbi:MAG: ABC transporter permease [Gemmataceae bacterium]|jgi:putative ABC transport system permease protein|nr:MAG: ABC transporter permease [Gemmataceae bacterium]